MYVVTVAFQIKPNDVSEFMDAMMKNARSSVTNEPGCQQFDVCYNEKTPHSVFLYEVYDDRQAFEAHMQTDHFSAVNTATQNLVVKKDVVTFDTLER